MKPLATRATGLAPSLTVSIDAQAKAMIARGLDVIALGAGEPDFDTPQNIQQAAIRSIQQNQSRYTATAGLPELKKSVCNKLLRENGLHYDPSQIVICSGAKHAVFNALQALIEPGDEVIIPTPYWVTYPELVRFLGGTPVILTAEMNQGFRITPQQLRKSITPRTKLLILNSPNNPSGAVYPSDTLREFAQILVQHDLYCLTDEIYEHMIYRGVHCSIASLGEEIQERTVLINGVSKSYAMTGWRIGYLAASNPLASAIARIQSQTTHHPANVSQWAAVEALDHGANFWRTMREALLERRDTTFKALSTIPGLRINEPEGAFYAFPEVRSYYGKKTSSGQPIKGSVDLCSWLLESQHLAIIPGAAFGMDHHVRLSYTVSLDKLQEALHRLRTGFLTLVG
ncbi:MAG TPA: pyridoxal phosphate-dependent aminotransferase [Fibrobacteraceae bacterium]|nr:pyridoxal phosphate-dependent aminotransferase [Fibrobacteraceae bacterium]